MTSEHVRPIDLESFDDEVLGSNQPVLVDFYADWCQPCRVLAPTIERIARDFDGRAQVGKVNVDESPELARTYGISSIPTLIVFRGGEEVDRIVGIASREELTRALERALERTAA